MIHTLPTRILLCSALGLGLGVAAPAQDMYAIAWSGTAYSINSSTGTGSVAGAVGFDGLNSMARVGSLILTARYTGELIAIDPTTSTGTLLTMTNPVLTQITSLAATPGGTVYAIQNGGSTSTPDKLYTIDINTGSSTLIGTTSFPGIQALSFGPGGLLYGWDVGTNGAGLITIDPATATSADVNPAVGANVDVQCLAMSPSGELYGARHALIRFDVTTAAATTIGSGGYSDVRGIEFSAGSTAASCTIRNGSGINLNACSCVTLPVLSTNWDIQVTTTPNTIGAGVWASVNPLSQPVAVPGGELLIMTPAAPLPSITTGLHRWMMPHSPQFVGFTVHVQGGRLDNGPNGLSSRLTNAIAGRLGL